MKRTLGFTLLLFVCPFGASARGEIPKPGVLAQPKPAEQTGLPQGR